MLGSRQLTKSMLYQNPESFKTSKRDLVQCRKITPWFKDYKVINLRCIQSLLNCVHRIIEETRPVS